MVGGWIVRADEMRMRRLERPSWSGLISDHLVSSASVADRALADSQLLRPYT